MILSDKNRVVEGKYTSRRWMKAARWQRLCLFFKHLSLFACSLFESFFASNLLAFSTTFFIAAPNLFLFNSFHYINIFLFILPCFWRFPAVLSQEYNYQRNINSNSNFKLVCVSWKHTTEFTQMHTQLSAKVPKPL